MSLDAMIDAVLDREGGFVNDGADPGGATKYGITRAVLAGWRGTDVAVSDVETLSVAEARAILAELYYRRPGIERLPESLQPLVFDSAVNHGPVTAVRLLQQVLGDVGAEPPAPDGILGPVTLSSVEKEERRLGPWLRASLVDERRRFYCRLAARRPEMARFLRGWLRRATAFDPERKDLP